MERARGELKTKLVGAACVILALGLTVRWYRVFYAVCMGYVFSDVPLHIQLALGHNDYGLSSLLIRALFALFQEPRALNCLALCMTVNNLLCVVCLWLLLRRLLPGLGGWYLLLASELALLCGPWLIPGCQTEIYLGAHNGNLYHNMTVLFSRTPIPLFFLFFLKCWDRRHSGVRWRDALAAAALLLLVTLYKPNFSFAFIPLLAGLLLYQLIKHRGRNFKSLVLLGCTVLPAGLACIWQYSVLFDDNFAGTSSSVAIRLLWGTELLALLLMYLRSLLLPVYTLSLQGSREPQREHIGLILLTEAAALLEATVFIETGYRATDGNFDWGGLAMYPLIFALAIGLLFRMFSRADMKRPGELVKCLLGLLLLLGHLAVGVYFLYIFTTGVSYFI